MATFQYKAVDRTGRSARGSLDAMNDVDLELRLRRMGLDMISFRAVEPRSIHALMAVKRQDVINLVFDLEQISRAGIPMLDGLRDLRDETGITYVTVSARFLDVAKIRSGLVLHAGDYERCKRLLIAAGRARRGKGRGGSVARITPEETS